MLNLPAWRSSLLLVLFAGLGAGCATYGYGVPRSGERVIVRAPAPVHGSTMYSRVDRDALGYTRQISRALRLHPQQQRAIHDRIARRTHILLDRSHPRDHRYVYPHPRRAHESERVVQRFWRDVDRDIERQLNSHQRRAYRDFVRHHYSDRARRGHPGHRRY